MIEGSFSQAGFSYQNHLAALKILELLDISSDILMVEMENFKKGAHIDDIIITRKQAIEYYQVKWSADENKAFTIHNLAFEQTKDEKATLWTKLKNGYLKKLTGGKDATITLYTTRPAGNGTSKKNPGVNKSLAQLQAFHKKFIDLQPLALQELGDYPEFKGTLDKLAAAIDFTPDQFELFFKTLRFKFSAPSQQYLENQLDNKADDLGLDTAQIDRLLRKVVSWSISAQEVTRELLLLELGIAERTRDRLAHTFKVDEHLYIENQALFSQLDAALESLPGGHMLVEGVPGAGKSTALTKYFAANPSVKFAYYCFIPDDVSGTDLRLKGDYFLKSLCVAIEANFPKLELPVRYSDKYEDRLSLYIERLGRLNERIVLMIDGLDHVDRQQAHVTDPLTNHIFSTLPENVFFIISSQYIEALPLPIRAVIEAEPKRRLVIDRFDIGKVRAYVEKKGLVVTDHILSLLHVKSEGIPLYLYYITSQLEGIPPRRQEDFIASLPVLAGGRIDTYHELLYLQIAEDETLVWMLALLAGRREYTTVEILQALLAQAGKSVDVLQLSRKLKRYKYLLKERDAVSYSLFHNSFRELILSKTRDLKAVINEALIGYYRQDPFEAEAFRNYFFHLFEMGRYNEIMLLVSDRWITISWSRYRSLEAITKNLNIAWQAAAEARNVSEFVRIGFLKYQVSLASFNLENLDFDDSTYFLAGGQIQASLQTIWDGEFSLIGKHSFFNFYAVKYFEKTGNPVSWQIAQQLFGNFNSSLAEPERPGREGPDFHYYFQARSLYLEPKIFFQELVERQEHIKTPAIKDTIRFLARHQKLLHLHELIRAKSANLKNFALAEMCLALFKKGSGDAVTFLDELTIDELEPAEQASFVNRIIDHLTTAEMLRRFGHIQIDPFLSNAIILDHHEHPLEEGFLQLAEDLKTCYFLKETSFSAFELRLSRISSYPRGFYHAISKSARLWVLQKKNIPQPSLMEELKQVVNHLMVDTYLASRIKDGYDAPSFIVYEIHNVHRMVFGMLKEICPEPDMSVLIRYWLEKHLSCGLRRHLSSLAIAELFNGTKNLSEEILLLLRQAEQLAREDHMTSSLVDRLTAVGMQYGEAGLITDFDRIYVELLVMACGVAHRKDYQFTEILPVLAAVGKIEPELTLARFAELYYLLFKLKDAGNPRMLHICLSYMIRFALQQFPQLGFKLLVRDDLYIDRDEGMTIVLDKFVAEMDPEMLPYGWAVLSTLNKWENFAKKDDNYVNMLYETFFKKAARGPDRELLIRAYRQVYHLAVAEHAQPESIPPINEILTSAGIDTDFLIQPTMEEPESDLPAKSKSTQPREKFMIRLPKLILAEIQALTADSHEQLYAHIEHYLFTQELNKLSPIWAELYAEVSPRLTDWFTGLPKQQQQDVRDKAGTLKRLFLNRKAAIARLKFQPHPFIIGLKQLLVDLEDALPGYGLAGVFENNVDIEQTAKQMIIKMQRLTPKIYGAITEEEILQLCRTAPFDAIERWVAFCERYLDKDILVNAMVSLSKRAFDYDEQKAKYLLKSALVMVSRIRFRDKNIERDIITWTYRCIPEEANYQLLFVFATGHMDAGSEIPYQIHKKILPWIQQFDEPNFFKEYYAANYEYNVKLASGLPEPDIDVSLILNHHENQILPETITDYLINLFDYPVVKIRELAEKALFELFDFNADLLTRVASTNLSARSSNQIEHFLVLLHSLLFKAPDRVAAILISIDWVFATGHFNLLQSYADLIVHAARTCDLPEALIEKALSVNREPRRSEPAIVADFSGPRTYGIGYYQAYLITTLKDNRKSPMNFSRQLYQQLESIGSSDSQRENIANQYSRHHNRNDNWDQIEINCPSFQIIQEQLNKFFHQCIRAGHYQNSWIQKIKYQFRLYDPTDVLYRRKEMPGYIHWKGKKVNESSFRQFKDESELFDQMLSRFEDKITIYEKGYQIFDQGMDYLSTHFEWSVLLADKQSSLTKVKSTLTEYPPYLSFDNLYRYEMAAHFESLDPPVVFEDHIYPIIAKSDRNFRHKSEGALAILIPHVSQHLKLTPDKESYHWNSSDGSTVLEFLEWQGPFKNGYSRRRFEPFAQGCTLTLKTELLKRYAEDAGKDLYVCLEVRRSTDKHVQEKEMRWEERVLIKKMNL